MIQISRQPKSPPWFSVLTEPVASVMAVDSEAGRTDPVGSAIHFGSLCRFLDANAHSCEFALGPLRFLLRCRLERCGGSSNYNLGGCKLALCLNKLSKLVKDGSRHFSDLRSWRIGLCGNSRNQFLHVHELKTALGGVEWLRGARARPSAASPQSHYCIIPEISSEIPGFVSVVTRALWNVLMSVEGTLCQSELIRSRPQAPRLGLVKPLFSLLYYRIICRLESFIL